MTTPTERVAEFVRGDHLERIPAEAIQSAKGGILDSVGVALAGSHEEPGRITGQLAREESANAEAALT